MKLLNILRRNFIQPLIISAVLAITLSMITVLHLSKSFFRDSLSNKMRKLKTNNVNPVVNLLQEVIYKRFQTIFDYLITAREFLDNYHETNITDEILKDKSYYANYVINLRTLYTNAETSIDENKMVWYINSKSTSLVKEFLDNEKLFNNKRTKKYLQLKYIYLFSKIIPVFKAFYENYKDKESFLIESFYIMNRKTEVLSIYPMKEYQKYKNMYDFSKSNKNGEFCLNKSMEYPDYFYLFCRESFVNIQNINVKNKNRNMYISYPYKFIDEENDRLGITLCYIFNFTDIDEIDDNNFKQLLDDEIIICANIIIDSINNMFDSFQNQLYGYYYILITNTKYPLYFPGISSDSYFNDIITFEFNHSSTYSILDITNFKTKTLPNLIKEYDYNKDIIIPNDSHIGINYEDTTFYYSVKTENLDNNYYKGEEPYKYSIFPIFFDDYHEKGKKEHVLSIIFTDNLKDTEIMKTGLRKQVIFISVFYCCVFGLICIILVTCLSQTIYIFGKNITKPIKDIKERLQKDSSKKFDMNLKEQNNKNEFKYQDININKLIALGLLEPNSNKISNQGERNSFSQYDFDQNTNDLLGKHLINRGDYFSDGNENNTEEQNNLFTDNKDLIDNNQNKEAEENEEDYDEDEIIPIKNMEISSKFNLLLELKKVFLFLENSQATFKISNVIKFISCNKVFHEIKNKIGENLCLSNMGNLENLNQRYDKAITFLSQSLGIENALNYFKSKFEESFEEILDLGKIIFEKDEKFPMDKTSIEEKDESDEIMESSVESNKNMSSKDDDIRNEINTNLNNQEFIRYMKLFYAYKMYFSNLKKLESILNKILNLTNNSESEGSYESTTYLYIKYISIYFNDYFVSKKLHITKAYKIAIYSCLYRLAKSRDVAKKKEKIIYCYIELFSYFISHIRISTKRSINEIYKEQKESNYYYSKSVNQSQGEINLLKMSSNSKSIERNEKFSKYFKKIYTIVEEIKFCLDKITYRNNIKESNISENERNKYLEFLSELRNVNKNSHNLEFNVFLLEQKFNYLFAKFSKLCGDYAMAITYYKKVIDKKNLVSNGILYIKANEKIRNIINYAKDNPQLLSIQHKDEEEAQRILNICNANLEEYKVNKYKDLIIVLDKSPSALNEKRYKLQLQQYKTIKYIFENYISINDRFAMYSFGTETPTSQSEENVVLDEDYFNYVNNNFNNNYIKKIMPLTFKNKMSYCFINSIIENFHDEVVNNFDRNNMLRRNWNDEEKMLLEENKKNGKEKYKNMKMKYAINTIYKIASELGKHEEDRKKYIILITESFQSEQNSEVKPNNIKNLLEKELYDGVDFKHNMKMEIERLFIVGTLLEKQTELNLAIKEIKNIYGIETEYLEFENIQELNKKLTTLGTLPRNYEYPNEKLGK